MNNSAMYKCEHCGYFYFGMKNIDGEIICEGQVGCPRCDGPQATEVCEYCGKQVCECDNANLVYKEVCIKPCNNGFDEYEISEANGEGYSSTGCLLAAVRENAAGNIVEEYEWTDDKNIRGHIHNEDRLCVIWYVQQGVITDYFGIVEEQNARS